MTTAEKIKVMQAFVDGKLIQSNSHMGLWEDWNREGCGEPNWCWGSIDYRVKPEPMEIEVWVSPDGRVIEYNAMEPGWTKKKFREVV